MTHILLSLFLTSCIAAIAMAQTYFRGEQTKFIQVRNNILKFLASIPQMFTRSLASQPEKVYVYSDRYYSGNRNKRF